MKQIWNILVLLLALNFLAVAVVLGWLYGSGRLDRPKVQAIGEILFPKAVAAQPATQPAKADPTTQPTLRLEELLAKVAGRSADEQVGFIQHAFDERMAQLDRRQRELDDFQRQTDLVRMRLADDRAAVDRDRKALEEQEKATARLQEDKGFQDSLKLYVTMTPKQAKAIFAKLDDQTIIQYLQAMPSRTAAAILKEFKAPDETERIRKVLEKMRQPSLGGAQ